MFISIFLCTRSLDFHFFDQNGTVQVHWSFTYHTVHPEFKQFHCSLSTLWIKVNYLVSKGSSINTFSKGTGWSLIGADIKEAACFHLSPTNYYQLRTPNGPTGGLKAFVHIYTGRATSFICVVKSHDLSRKRPCNSKTDLPKRTTNDRPFESSFIEFHLYRPKRFLSSRTFLVRSFLEFNQTPCVSLVSSGARELLPERLHSTCLWCLCGVATGATFFFFGRKKAMGISASLSLIFDMKRMEQIFSVWRRFAK